MTTTRAELGIVDGNDPIAIPGPRPGAPVAGKSPTRIAIDRLRRDRMAVVCSVVVLLLVLAGVLAPLVNHLLGIYGMPGDMPYKGSDVLYFGGPDTGLPTTGPPLNGFDAAHPLGLAPGTGVDNLARLLLGLRTSLLTRVAGFLDGWVDRVAMFTTDLFLSFPFLLGALALAPILRSRIDPEDLGAQARASLVALVVILVVFGWMGLARLIRGQVQGLREREFVQAAEVIGVSTSWIVFRELLPNTMAPIIVYVSLALPGYVAAEAGLSYLGIGLTGQPSLGQTILDAQQYFKVYPLYLWAPVVVVGVLVLALNLLGDSVRDAFDPKTRR